MREISVGSHIQFDGIYEMKAVRSMTQFGPPTHLRTVPDTILWTRDQNKQPTGSFVRKPIVSADIKLVCLSLGRYFSLYSLSVTILAQKISY